MAILLSLLLAIGLLPLMLGTVLLRPSPRGTWPPIQVGSVLLCALAFNLTFFWQELWLVIPKALTPGLHPILYHNNHDWTGDAPTVELLQGTGALATLASGLTFASVLGIVPGLSATWRAFIFWMTFQGLFQSLTQLAIGAMLPGNDVARALAYLDVGTASKWALLAVDIAAMAAAGVFLARVHPSDGESCATSGRAFAQKMLMTVGLAIMLIVPFRLPRNAVEVALIPLFVNLVGVGWLALGASIAGRAAEGEDKPPGFVGPALALGVTLFLFQLVLRPGIAF